MFLITFISESVNDRAIVSMAEDLWVLPFLIAIYCLPDNPNQWIYFVRCIVLANQFLLIEIIGTSHRIAVLSVHSSDPSWLVLAKLRSGSEPDGKRFTL